jgi:Uma2 family endonuclease
MDPAGPYIHVVPDWVCEVLSPRTALVDRRLKMRIYAREQVPYVWLVEPLARTLEVYRLDGEGYRATATHGENEIARITPFDAIELDLGALWPNPSLSP